MYEPTRQELRKIEEMVKIRAKKICATSASNIDYDELISAGNMAVAECLTNYVAGDATFTTYSYRRIKGAMIDYVRSVVSKGARRTNVENRAVFVELDETIVEKPPEYIAQQEILFGLIDTLSDEREKRILELYLTGMTHKEIGEEIGLSRARVQGIMSESIDRMKAKSGSRADNK